MLRRVCVLMTGVAIVGVTANSARAATISITATSIATGNFASYQGLGDLGGGVGHGFYQLGTCAFDSGANRTNCLVTGSYQEIAGSVTPGATGTFTFRTSWLGNVANPVQARSNTMTVEPNDLVLH